jgi:hypothetical protein
VYRQSDGEADVDMGAESGDTTESEDEDQDAVSLTMKTSQMRSRWIGMGEGSWASASPVLSPVGATGRIPTTTPTSFSPTSTAPSRIQNRTQPPKSPRWIADGEDGEQDSADEIAEAMTLAAAAGLYDGWEGPIVFAARDVDVEMDLSSPRSSRRRRMSSSILTTDDDQAGQRTHDPTVGGGEDHLSEENGIDLAESDGETTEDELIGADGRPNARAMMLFKWPVSIGAVDPMNTLTPGRRGNGRAPRHSVPQHEPEDLDDSSDKSLDGIKTPNGRKSGAPRTPRGPVAGTFQLTPESVEPVKAAVITGHQPALPSPYPRSRRLFSSGEGIGHRVCIQTHGIH